MKEVKRVNELFIFIFGIFGGLARYYEGTYLNLPNGFPLGTMIVNLVGSFFFTFLIKHYLGAKNVPERIVLGIGTGFIGGFTTFSSLMLDTFQLLSNQQYFFLFLYLSVSVIGGLSSSALGMKVGRRVVRS